MITPRAYRPSGVTWIGDIPAHWTVAPLKRLVRFQRGHDLPSEERVAGHVPIVSSGGVIGTHDKHSATGPGIVTGRYGSIGTFHLIEGNYWPLNTALYSIELHGNDPRYVVGVLSSMAPFFEMESKKSAVPGVDRNDLHVYMAPIPPKSEQRRIADFIDERTAAIDALIEKKERLIALLAEKRQGLITQAVTKGLHPNAPMKDSGVDWLGAMPSHWQVFRSRRLFLQRRQRANLEDEQLTASQAYGVIPQKDYVAKTGQRVVQLTTNFELRKRVEIDDFVISMRSFEGGLERAWSAGGIRSSYVVLRPSEAVDVGYFTHLFKCSAYIAALQGTALFIRDGQDLNFDNFVLVDLPLPPKEEQRRIADYLDSRIAALVNLSEKSRKLIEQLREYRQALITAAVTGKLDVAHTRMARMPQMELELA